MGAGMHREEDLLPERVQLLEYILQLEGIVHIVRTVQCEDAEGHIRDHLYALFSGGFHAHGQAVCHHVAHQLCLIQQAFMLEVVHACLGGHQEQIGEVVCHDAVDFLRHTAVEAA